MSCERNQAKVPNNSSIALLFPLFRFFLFSLPFICSCLLFSPFPSPSSSALAFTVFVFISIRFVRFCFAFTGVAAASNLFSESSSDVSLPRSILSGFVSPRTLSGSWEFGAEGRRIFLFFFRGFEMLMGMGVEEMGSAFGFGFGFA